MEGLIIIVTLIYFGVRRFGSVSFECVGVKLRAITTFVRYRRELCNVKGISDLLLQYLDMSKVYFGNIYTAGTDYTNDLIRSK